MYWNKTRLESNLSAYEYKGIRLDEFFSYTKKVLLDQLNKDDIDRSEDLIPEESDTYEILPPDSIGTINFDFTEMSLTIDVLSEFETKIRQNIDKQSYFIHKLRNEIEKAYKSSTEFPYVLHAVIIHEGEAMTGHYYW